MPVFDDKDAYPSVICTSLEDFPVYLLPNGVDDFLKAMLMQQSYYPMDWQFVEDMAWRERNEDAKLPAEQLDMVQKHLVGIIKSGGGWGYIG